MNRFATRTFCPLADSSVLAARAAGLQTASMADSEGSEEARRRIINEKRLQGACRRKEQVDCLGRFSLYRAALELSKVIIGQGS